MDVWEKQKKELEKKIPKEESNKRRLSSQDSTQSKLNAPKTRKVTGADSSLSFLNQSESSVENIESANTTVESMDQSSVSEKQITVEQLESVVNKMVNYVFQPKMIPTTWFELFVMPIYQDTVYLFCMYFNHKPNFGYLQGTYIVV